MNLVRDFRYICRSLVRSPGYAAAVVLTLILGIGANTALFLLVNAAFFRPLPYGHADELMMIWSPRDGASTESTSLVVSYPDFLDWQKRSSSFTGLAAYNVTVGDLTVTDMPITIGGAMVTKNFFSVLQAHPFLGTDFTQTGNDEAVIVLGYDLWQKHFGGRASVLGEKVLLSGHPYTVIGVLSASFAQPEPFWEGNAQFWLPIPSDSVNDSRSDRRYRVIGRMRSTVSMAACQVEMRRIGGQLAQEFPKTNGDHTVKLVSLRQQLFGEFYKPLLLLFLGTIAVLLIACANVANLQLARIISRSSETLIRIALGASRFRLSFWAFGEAALLALLGAGGGVVFASLLMRLPLVIGKRQLELVHRAKFDARMIVFIFVTAMTVALLASFVPIVHMLKSKSGAVLGFNKASKNNGQIWNRFRSALAIAQLCLVLPLLIGSTLFSRSFYKLSHVDPGFRSEQLFTFRVSLSSNLYPDPAQAQAFLDRLDERLKAIPGVQSVAFTSAVPLLPQNTRYWRSVSPDTEPLGQDKNVYYRVVSPSFFEVMGIPILSGQSFSSLQNAQRQGSAVINEALARNFWPGEDPIGKRIRINGLEANGGVVWVSGVVKNIHDDSLAIPVVDTVYVSFAADPWRSTAVIVRTGLPPDRLLPEIRSTISSLNPKLPITSIWTMQDVVHAATGQSRFALLIVTISAALAFVLALLGVAGVVAYLVANRQQEFGIRIALGAHPDDIIRLVLAYGFKLACAGSIVGIAIAISISRLFGHFIYGVTASDLVSYIGATLLLFLASLFSCYIPARKIIQIDPMMSLRVQ